MLSCTGLLTVLVGCVSIDMPGVVTDTARVGKDVYRAATGKDQAEPELEIRNSTIGRPEQTLAQVRQACISEAVDKLERAVGQAVDPKVLDTSFASVNNTLVVHCRVGRNKPSTRRG